MIPRLVRHGFSVLSALLWSLSLVLSVRGEIPLVDLASDATRQSLVDREEGQYIGHPTTVLLEDGHTVLCVYPKGHGKGAIQLKRSTDGGLTWSPRQPVPDNWATTLETPTTHRGIDAPGHRRLIVWAGPWPARLSVSEDDGSSWSPLKAAGDWGGIVVMGSLEPVRNKPGHYLAWFHDDGRYISKGAQPANPSIFRLYQVRSEDGGLTWSQPRVLWSDSAIHLCEPGSVRSPDGHTLVLLLRENRRKLNSHFIVSTDEGASCSPPKELPLSLTGDRHTAKYTRDGRLVISFRDTAKGSTTAGDWIAWVGQFSDLLSGREGQYRIRLGDNQHAWDCAYPGVEVLGDGTVLATTYGHWDAGKSPYIISVRFTLKEIARRLSVNP